MNFSVIFVFLLIICTTMIDYTICLNIHDYKSHGGDCHRRRQRSTTATAAPSPSPPTPPTTQPGGFNTLPTNAPREGNGNGK